MSTTGESVETNDYCGDDAVGYMEVCENGDYIYILTSGAPDHPAEYDQVMVNPNVRCKYQTKICGLLNWDQVYFLCHICLNFIDCAVPASSLL